LELRRLSASASSGGTSSASSGGVPMTTGGQSTGGKPEGGEASGGQSASGGKFSGEAGAASVGGADSDGDDMGSAGAGTDPTCPGPYCELCPEIPSCDLPMTRCVGWKEKCAKCLSPSDCGPDEVCDPYLYQCTPRCLQHSDCPPDRLHCEPIFGGCNNCDNFSWVCGPGWECVNGKCVACSEVPWCTE
jgi:hypothetical protein